MNFNNFYCSIKWKNISNNEIKIFIYKKKYHKISVLFLSIYFSFLVNIYARAE